MDVEHGHDATSGVGQREVEHHECADLDLLVGFYTRDIWSVNEDLVGFFTWDCA